MEWYQTDNTKPIWIENESQSIGSNIIPPGLYEQMRTAPVLEIMLDKEIRKKRILNEYGIFSIGELSSNTMKVAKRLGGLRLKEALAFLEEKNLPDWADIMMEYYDNTYDHSNKKRAASKIVKMELLHDRMDENAACLIEKWKGFIYSE